MDLAVSAYRFRASFSTPTSKIHKPAMTDDDHPELTIRRDAAIAACRQALRAANRRFEARQAELAALREQAEQRRTRTEGPTPAATSSR